MCLKNSEFRGLKPLEISKKNSDSQFVSSNVRQLGRFTKQGALPAKVRGQILVYMFGHISRLIDDSLSPIIENSISNFLLQRLFYNFFAYLFCSTEIQVTKKEKSRECKSV